jgi:threonine dehydrogenase-like Zn-dependent dehydrogenase
VVDVERAGVCGTDMEFFSGHMSYLHTGQARYPMRIGHEWAGTVARVGEGVDGRWVGTRVTGDTMLGCGHCDRCTRGRQHLCADRYEIGVRNGWPGALAEQLPVPVRALQALPEAVDEALGAMVEPGGNALRAVQAAALEPGERLLVLGPGTIGLLVAMFARAQGAEVHVMGPSESGLEFPRSLGFQHAWTRDNLPDLPWDAVVDASNARELPTLGLQLVEPGRRVVYIGLAEEPSLIDTRTLVLKDVTAVGILSASGGLAGAIAHYAQGSVDPRPLIAVTLGLDELPQALRGERNATWGHAPKIHVDPRR